MLDSVLHNCNQLPYLGTLKLNVRRLRGGLPCPVRPVCPVLDQQAKLAPTFPRSLFHARDLKGCKGSWALASRSIIHHQSSSSQFVRAGEPSGEACSFAVWFMRFLTTSCAIRHPRSAATNPHNGLLFCSVFSLCCAVSAAPIDKSR